MRTALVLLSMGFASSVPEKRAGRNRFQLQSSLKTFRRIGLQPVQAVKSPISPSDSASLPGATLVQMKIDFDINRNCYRLALALGGSKPPGADCSYGIVIQAHAKGMDDAHVSHLPLNVDDDAQTDDPLKFPGASSIGELRLRAIQGSGSGIPVKIVVCVNLFVTASYGGRLAGILRDCFLQSLDA